MRYVEQYNWNKLFDNLAENVEEQMLETAKDKVPVQSGDLRDSIVGEIVKDTITVTAEESYAVTVELGDNDNPPQPYLRPALKTAADNIKQVRM